MEELFGGGGRGEGFHGFQSFSLIPNFPRLVGFLNSVFRTDRQFRKNEQRF